MSAITRERNAQRTRVQGLQEHLHALRADADSCRGALAWEEASFQEYDRSVDSLRREVRQIEGPDREGVPAEEYDDYLELFDRYNTSVRAWEARADSLGAHAEACRALVGTHNLAADSLQAAFRRLRDGIDGGG